MKKLVLLLALLIPMVASAQWDKTHYDADELKGESAYDAFIYHDSENNYFVYWTNEDEIKVGCRRGIFDYSDHYVGVIVGFYEGDKLIEKVNARFYVPSGDSDTAFTSQYRNPGLGKKIIEHINNVGDVRFIIGKYSGADFDLRVPKRK